MIFDFLILDRWTWNFQHRVVILQKIWAIGFWSKISKLMLSLKKYDNTIKRFVINFCPLIKNQRHTKFQVKSYLWCWYSTGGPNGYLESQNLGQNRVNKIETQKKNGFVIKKMVYTTWISISCIKFILTLIWVGFLGVRFELMVGGGGGAV